MAVATKRTKGITHLADHPGYQKALEDDATAASALADLEAREAEQEAKLKRPDRPVGIKELLADSQDTVSVRQKLEGIRQKKAEITQWRQSHQATINSEHGQACRLVRESLMEQFEERRQAYLVLKQHELELLEAQRDDIDELERGGVTYAAPLPELFTNSSGGPYDDFHAVRNAIDQLNK